MKRMIWSSVTMALLAGCGANGAASAPKESVAAGNSPVATTTTTGAASTKSVVLVHGAFADGSSWDKVIPLLQAKGFEVTAVHNPLTGMAADVDAVTRTIEQQTKPVVLVGHSWGGTLITQAGNNPKVASLVYVCAFAPNDGQTTNETTKEYGPPPWGPGVRPDSGGFLSLSKETYAAHFAQDLPRPVLEVMAAAQGPIQAKSFDEKVTQAAWHSKPTTYIVGSQDHMIPPDLERKFAARMNATTVELPTSHVAMLSKPDEVAAAIIAAADKAK